MKRLLFFALLLGSIAQAVPAIAGSDTVFRDNTIQFMKDLSSLLINWSGPRGFAYKMFVLSAVVLPPVILYAKYKIDANKASQEQAVLDDIRQQ